MIGSLARYYLNSTLSRNIVSYSLLLALITALLSCKGSAQRQYKRNFFSLDTSIEVTLYASRDPSAVFDSLQAIIFGLDSMLSISNAGSEVWKVNHRSGAFVKVRPVTASIVRFCCKECEKSGGFFDISVAPLKYLYGLESHQKDNLVPSAGQLENVRRVIGCGRIHVIGDIGLLLDSGVTMDLGGIAKGYLLERLKTFLLREGQKRFLINLGGDLIAWGQKPEGKPWVVGIQHPRKPEVLLATLSVSNTCVFTSGDYERYFMKNGVRYHHLFDPHTAAPARKNQSSTVVGADPMSVDARVKVAFFLYAPRAIDYLKSLKLQGVIVDSTGTVWASATLKDILQPDSSVTVKYR
jgi:Membrane-associated lipoprotein involved in thiamine biosynthesis